MSDRGDQREGESARRENRSDWVKHLESLGFLVLPSKRGHKFPGYTGFKTCRTREGALALMKEAGHGEWDPKSCNYSIRMPRKFVALDFDKFADADRAVQHIADNFPDDFAKMLEVTTPSRGCHLVFRLPSDRGDFLKSDGHSLKKMGLKVGDALVEVEVARRPQEPGSFGGMLCGPESCIKMTEKGVEKQISRGVPEEMVSEVGDSETYSAERTTDDFKGEAVSDEFAKWLKDSLRKRQGDTPIEDMAFDPQDPKTRTAKSLAEMLRRLNIRVVHEPRLALDMIEVDGVLREIDDGHVNDIRCAIIDEFGISLSNTLINDNLGSFKHMESMRFDMCREWLDTMIHGGDEPGGEDGRLAEEWLFPMGVQDTELDRFLSASILVSIIQRIREPDLMIRFNPTLVGPSHAGKSSMIHGILPEGPIRKHFYTASVNFKLSEKELLENVEGKLVCEADELVGGHQQDVAAIKSFCTKRVFHYRKSYGRRRSEVPNLWTIIGSANPEMPFLADDRGLLLRWPIIEIRHKNTAGEPSAYLDGIRTALFQSANRLYEEGMRTSELPERFEAEVLDRVTAYKSIPEHIREILAVLLGNGSGVPDWPDEIDMEEGASAGQICEAFPSLHPGSDSNRVGKALANHSQFESRMVRGRRLYFLRGAARRDEVQEENVVSLPRRRGKGAVADAKRRYMERGK